MLIIMPRGEAAWGSASQPLKLAITLLVGDKQKIWSYRLQGRRSRPRDRILPDQAADRLMENSSTGILVETRKPKMALATWAGV
jgi:hypothetical protein